MILAFTITLFTVKEDFNNECEGTNTMEVIVGLINVVIFTR